MIGRDYLEESGYRISVVEKRCGMYGRTDIWGIKFGNFYTKNIEVKVQRHDYTPSKLWKFRKNDNCYFGEDVIPAEENYILCPSELIQPREVYNGFGLLWYDGKKIIKMKTAKFRQIN
jgi:hypothetical protein